MCDCEWWKDHTEREILAKDLEVGDVFRLLRDKGEVWSGHKLKVTCITRKTPYDTEGVDLDVASFTPGHGGWQFLPLDEKVLLLIR